MRRFVCAAGLFIAATSLAQQPQNLYPQPRVSTCLPAGVRAGATVEVIVTGTDLDDATGLAFSHPGLSATVIPPEVPKPDPKADAKKDGGKRKGPTGPATVKAKVSAAVDVPAGVYDVRVVNKWGVSNSRAFVVGPLPEGAEKEPNNDVPDAQRVVLGSVVNGQINSPTDVDYFTFPGRAGQRVLLHCATTSIDSKARPLVEVFSKDQRRLGMNRNYKDGDALADVTLPADGEYSVRVSEFAYQFGGQDSFYRLSFSTGPWVDAVFPPRVEPGKTTSVTVLGRNLPGGKPVGVLDGKTIEAVETEVVAPAVPTPVRVRIDPVGGTQDAFEFRFPGTNPFPIYLAKERVVLEAATNNDTPEKAQPLPVPCEVAGFIGKPNDRDWYSFAAKKWDVFAIDLFAERVGSDVDAVLTIVNAASKQEIVGEGQLDDDNETLHPIEFYTRTADPPGYKFTAPQDGTYLVRVGSREASVEYGPRAYYQLRIGKPRPDVRVVVVPRSRELPAATVLHPGGQAALDVLVQRMDGYAGPVTVSAAGLPAGVTAKPALVGSGQRWGTLILRAAPDTKDASGPFDIAATIEVDGRPAAIPARPAAITWAIGQGQNAPAIARLDQTLPIAVRRFKPELRIDVVTPRMTVKPPNGKDEPVKAGRVFKPGEKITIPVSVDWSWWTPRPNAVTLFVEPTVPQSNQNSSPFTGQTLNLQVPVPKEKREAAVTLDLRPNCPPGRYATVIRGETQFPYSRDPAAAQRPAVTTYAFSSPVEFTVVPNALARVTVPAPRQPLKPGGSVELTVRIDRLLDYNGEFTLAVTFPKEGAALAASPVVIPAGQTEAKVNVSVASDAKPGAVPNVTVVATALYDGKYPIVQEGKVNLTISK